MFLKMMTVSTLYRFLIAIFLCFLNFTQWLHRIIIELISRNRYTITVNIGVSRTDQWTISDDQLNNIKFNKSTDVIAVIINERIPDVDLWRFVSNLIRFFRTLNVQHLVIYDYEGKY